MIRTKRIGEWAALPCARRHLVAERLSVAWSRTPQSSPQICFVVGLERYLEMRCLTSQLYARFYFLPSWEMLGCIFCLGASHKELISVGHQWKL